MKLQTLTHSRMQCRKTCPKKHHLAYELGIRREYDHEPFRVGTAVHEALDAHARHMLEMTGHATPLEAGLVAIAKLYDREQPPFLSRREWDAERTICECLFTGYVWRWQEDGTEVLATEQVFDLPIVNPATGRESRTYRFGGKIDKIVQWNGAPVVMEHKTTGDSIHDESEYWDQLRVDTQISGYYMAARALGFDVQSVLYDVIHKPGMRPLDSKPCLDEQGRKIVVHKGTNDRAYKSNGEPYLSAGRDDLEYLSAPETVEQFRDRLMTDIYDRPDFYYARREIPRLDSDIEEFRRELWTIAQDIRSSERNGWHYRNTQACRKPYPCEYREACWQGFNFDRGEPTGFVRVANVHPELQGDRNVRADIIAATA